MTLSSIAALFAAMITLAMIPSPSVFAVVARAIASGFTHGAISTMGILVGDFIFIVLAICGLATIAEKMESLFILVKYLGGAYLIWLGISLSRSKSEAVELTGIKETSWLSSFLSGLFITLSDPKAILFYMGFFPAFIELSQISLVDVTLILAIATIAVGGSKLGYAYMADKSRLLFKSSQAKKAMNIIAGSVTMGTGIFLIGKT